MDGDLQHPPGKILDLFQAWRQGYKVVNTFRIDTEDTSAFKRLTSQWFYGIFFALSGLKMSKGSSDFRLIDQQVLQVLKQMRDADLFIRGIINWVGFPATTITYQAKKRLAGNSKYTLRKMVRFSVAGLVSFSSIPLRLGIWIGLITGFLAFVEIVYILIRYFQGSTVPGWASILTVMSFMFGVLFILLGIIGMYLGTISETLKNRPPFLINEVIGFPDR